MQVHITYKRYNESADKNRISISRNQKDYALWPINGLWYDVGTAYQIFSINSRLKCFDYAARVVWWKFLFVIDAVWKELVKLWYFRQTFRASKYFGSFWFVYKMHYCLNSILCFLLLLLSKLDNTSGRNNYLTIECTFFMQTFYCMWYNMAKVYYYWI